MFAPHIRVTLALFAVLVVSAAACDGGGSSASSSPPRTVGPGDSRTNPIKLGQLGRVEGLWEITVVYVDRDAWPVVGPARQSNQPPAANERMLLITVRAKNISTSQKPENINPLSFRLVGSRNNLYDFRSGDIDCGFIPQELDVDLLPGALTQGNICFKVPADEHGFVLVWGEDERTYFALE